jgi:hypothetical protein
LQTIINFSTSFFLHLSFRFSTPSLSLSIFSPLRHMHSSITLPTVSVCVWLCGNYKMRDERIKCEPSDYIFILNTHTTWYSFLIHRFIHCCLFQFFYETRGSEWKMCWNNISDLEMDKHYKGWQSVWPDPPKANPNMG